MVETIDGTATFVRNPLIPPEAEAIIAIPYDVQSSAIKWSVSGSHTEAGCKTTYSGSGTDTAIPNTFVDTGMTLQDVHANPAAPVPEPMPFYYSIRASSDPTDAPLFTITRSGTAGCNDRQPGADHRHLPRDRQPRRPQLGDAARRDRQERRHQPARGPPPHRRRHRPTQRRHLELPGVGLGADFRQASERTRTAGRAGRASRRESGRALRQPGHPRGPGDVHGRPGHQHQREHHDGHGHRPRAAAGQGTPAAGSRPRSPATRSAHSSSSPASPTPARSAAGRATR